MDAIEKAIEALTEAEAMTRHKFGLPMSLKYEQAIQSLREYKANQTAKTWNVKNEKQYDYKYFQDDNLIANNIEIVGDFGNTVNQTEYNCDVCQDDPVQCGALPSMRHCPKADHTGAEGMIVFLHSHYKTGEFLEADFTCDGFSVDLSSYIKDVKGQIKELIKEKSLQLDEVYKPYFIWEDGLCFINNLIPLQSLTAPNPQPVSGGALDWDGLNKILRGMRARNEQGCLELTNWIADNREKRQALAQAGGTEKTLDKTDD